MDIKEDEDVTLKLLDKVQNELKNIEALCSDYSSKERIKRLLEYIELETGNNKAVFLDMILFKVKQTKGRYPELHTDFYLLYRNVMNNKLSLQDARILYEMYVKELTTLQAV